MCAPSRISVTGAGARPSPLRREREPRRTRARGRRRCRCRDGEFRISGVAPPRRGVRKERRAIEPPIPAAQPRLGETWTLLADPTTAGGHSTKFQRTIRMVPLGAWAPRQPTLISARARADEKRVSLIRVEPRMENRWSDLDAEA